MPDVHFNIQELSIQEELAAHPLTMDEVKFSSSNNLFYGISFLDPFSSSYGYQVHLFKTGLNADTAKLRKIWAMRGCFGNGR